MPTFDEFLKRAAISRLNGYLVLAFGFIYNGLLFAIAILTANIQHASGEVLSKPHFRLRQLAGLKRSRRRKRLPDAETTATFQPVKRSGISNTETFKPVKRRGISDTGTFKPRDPRE